MKLRCGDKPDIDLRGCVYEPEISISQFPLGQSLHIGKKKSVPKLREKKITAQVFIIGTRHLRRRTRKRQTRDLRSISFQPPFFFLIHSLEPDLFTVRKFRRSFSWLFLLKYTRNFLRKCRCNANQFICNRFFGRYLKVLSGKGRKNDREGISCLNYF